ncbi:hypothetical protein [Nonomuraea sp. NPDC005650]|uniref:hypothetical protein n=1 Tax=Nonomuraea sp. NPDC005650 TaxID=3157045 RepID=UPI0033AD72CE
MISSDNAAAREPGELTARPLIDRLEGDGPPPCRPAIGGSSAPSQQNEGAGE